MAEESDLKQAAEQSPEAAEAEQTPTDAETKPKRKYPWSNWKRWQMTVAVIVIVIVVAGIGMFAWHETPSFCGTVCHNPMNYYVETYSTDNEGMLVKAHADEGNNCLSCHEPTMTEQVSELMTWLADDYEMTESGQLAEDANLASEEFCTKNGCHDMSEVVANTWGFEENDAKYNPHSSHQDMALECGDCHKAHETSVLVCNQCHALNMPEGWEAPHDAE